MNNPKIDKVNKNFMRIIYQDNNFNFYFNKSRKKITQGFYTVGINPKIENSDNEIKYYKGIEITTFKTPFKRMRGLF